MTMPPNLFTNGEASNPLTRMSGVLDTPAKHGYKQASR